MKKILFIIPCVPYPLNSGGNQAFFNMVDYIRDKISVSILFESFPDHEKHIADLKNLWQNVDFYVFTKNEKEILKQPLVRNTFYYKWLKKLQSSIEHKMRRQLLSAPARTAGKDLVRERSVLSDSVFKGLNVDYVDYVAKIANLGFDIIQVEFYELIALGYILPPDAQTIFMHHELRYIRNENEMTLFKKVTPDDSMHFLAAKDFERDALLRFKHVISLTTVDKLQLNRFLGREDRIYTSPAVVQLEPNPDIEFVPCTHNRLTFVGYGGHSPNLDAVVWFCSEVAPYLHQRGFKFTFQVIGVGYDWYLSEHQLTYPDMVTIGYVDELEPFLQGSIALVPIRIGSGMRMKILDMVSLQVPFITTSKGLEGIDFSHEKECLIADTASDFADAIIKLSGDMVLQRELAGQAKDKLKEVYNPQKMLEQRLSIYTSILKDEK